MAAFSRGLIRLLIISCFLVILVTISNFYDQRAARYGVLHPQVPRQRVFPDTATTNPNTLTQRLDLDERECRLSFPGLFADIDAAVARGKFKFEPSPADYQGLVQACIINNNLHILTTSPASIPQILHQRTSILSQIHRALLTSPSALPNTTFAFAINDVPKNNSWGFARPNKRSSYNTWLMPSFAGWSWPKENLGVMDDILHRIASVEKDVPWKEKADKVVWRGTPWFNPIAHPNLRKDLVKVAKGKEWADVQALNASNALPIEDFCRYKYIVYTEGVSYSGRLPYHQACESIMITAPLTWLTTSALMVRPIWVGDLLSGGNGTKEVKGALPTVSSYKDANAIYVDPEFLRLEDLIQFLHTNPGVARRIAMNQRDLMVGGGYLSLAAETCYWRALIKGWSKVVVAVKKEWGDEEGERFETWLLKEAVKTREATRGKVSRRRTW